MKVKEIFYSIQGEGYNFGKPVIFLRTYTCNFDCSWCDERLSRQHNGEGEKFERSLEDILLELCKLIHVNNCHSIIFTGGEPSLYSEELIKLIDFLNQKFKGMWYGIETNGTGTREFYNKIDYICISPKYGQSTKENLILYKRLYDGDLYRGEVKIVVDRRDNDFIKWIKEIYTQTYMVGGRLGGHELLFYLSPVTECTEGDMLDWTNRHWSFNIEDLMYIYNEIKDIGDIRISLQLHKLIGVR